MICSFIASSNVCFESENEKRKKMGLRHFTPKNDINIEEKYPNYIILVLSYLENIRTTKKRDLLTFDIY
jgi:hypothetical protein